MANTNTTSNQKTNQTSGSHTQGSSTTNSSSNTSSHSEYGSNTTGYGFNYSQSNSASKGGSHSTTTGESIGQSHSQGGANSQTAGMSWASGQVSDRTQQKFEESGNDYVQSENVANAYNNLQQAISGKPAFQSTYASKLDELYGQLMNRDKFNYNFNEDAMYQMYKDQYQQGGQRAMRDTMGQAAAMTGGYGSSYAQTAGQQTYQGYLQELNQLIPQLRQQAYEEYRDEGQDLLNKYNITSNAYDREYGQYRDAVGDWQSDRSFDYGMYSDERNFDYNKYQADRNYWQNEYWNEKNSAQSNASNSESTNYSDSTSYQKNQSTTDSTNWQNTTSNTLGFNWNTSQTNGWQDTTSKTNSTSTTNSSQDTTGWSNSETNSNSSSVSSGTGGSGSGASTMWTNQNAATFNERSNLVNDDIDGLATYYNQGNRTKVGEILVGLRENGLTRSDGTHIGFTDHDVAQLYRDTISKNNPGAYNITDKEALQVISQWVNNPDEYSKRKK